MPKLANAMPTYLAMTSVGFISSSPVLGAEAVATTGVSAGQLKQYIIVYGQRIGELESPKATAPLLDTPQTITVVRDSAQYSRTDPFNLQQVEVYNGANSVFNGSGSVGGTINLVTKAPQGDDLTIVQAGVGTDGLLPWHARHQPAAAIQTLAQDCGQANPAIIQLTGVYHNLLRRWADA